MRRHKLTIKVFLAIVMTDVVESVAEIFMKNGLNGMGIVSVNFNNFSECFLRGASSPFIWAGISLYVINFFIWIAVLTRVQLSVAFPVGSTSYVFVAILAAVFLREAVTPLRWLGIALIILGIHFVSKSKQETDMAGS